jgi:hypothetical protein
VITTLTGTHNAQLAVAAGQVACLTDVTQNGQVTGTAGGQCAAVATR